MCSLGEVFSYATVVKGKSHIPGAGCFSELSSLPASCSQMANTTLWYWHTQQINKEQLSAPDSQQNYQVPWHLYPGQVIPIFNSKIVRFNFPFFSSSKEIVTFLFFVRGLHTISQELTLQKCHVRLSSNFFQSWKGQTVWAKRPPVPQGSNAARGSTNLAPARNGIPSSLSLPLFQQTINLFWW